MKILITEIFESQSELLVRFHSEIGNGIALWNGVTPKTGDTLDVELDINEVFSWQKNIESSSTEASLITAINSTVQITAKLIQGANENCVALKLGDSIILIEIEESLPQKSCFVQITTTKLHLYPTNT